MGKEARSKFFQYLPAVIVIFLVCVFVVVNFYSGDLRLSPPSTFDKIINSIKNFLAGLF